MTEISFHLNVEDRATYACRLLRKATRLGASVVVTGPAPDLAHLDRVLWTFDPIEFVPHRLAGPDDAIGADAAVTPVWLLENTAQAPHHDVLVNLGADPPGGFESFARVVELVGADEAGRAAARQRYRHYAARGYAIQTHEAGA